MMAAEGASISWRRDPGLPFQRLQDETLVVQPRTREVHLLNDTAARIWELLADERTLAELVRVLEPEYDVAPEVLGQEVAAFVADLERRGLVTAGAAPPRAR